MIDNFKNLFIYYSFGEFNTENEFLFFNTLTGVLQLLSRNCLFEFIFDDILRFITEISSFKCLAHLWRAPLNNKIFTKKNV